VRSGCGQPGLVDYDPVYRDRKRVCGAPFPEFRAFFDAYARRRASVLDLGCGQGRDALMAARLGHTTLGVDLSAAGVAQMCEEAAADGLRVQGRVGDIRSFRARRRFDVVLLDRVLHLLPDDAERRRTLRRLSSLTRPGSFVLIADTARHRGLIRGFFERRPSEWRVARRNANFLCVERVLGRARRGATGDVSRPRIKRPAITATL